MTPIEYPPQAEVGAAVSNPNTKTDFGPWGQMSKSIGVWAQRSPYGVKLRVQKVLN
jgi:hypothetical protein